MISGPPSFSLVQEFLILLALILLPVAAYLLNLKVTRHIDLISKRLGAIQKTKLLELARELLMFFGSSKASDSVTRMLNSIKENGNEDDFESAAAEAIPDIEQLHRSLSEVLDPTISVSKIRADKKYILLLVLMDGVFLSSIIILIFLNNQNFEIGYIYLIIEYLDIAWAIVISFVFKIISSQVSNLEDSKLSSIIPNY
jgi:hypothetical protein